MEVENRSLEAARGYAPDCVRRPGVARGRLSEFVWSSSGVYPGSMRRCRVFVPAQYNEDSAASLMIFQDGWAWAELDGAMRTPIVLENLIAAGEMPVTIAVFVDPGVVGRELPPALSWAERPENRELEYDTFSERYSQLLIDEILPRVRERYAISEDPDSCAIAGMSSGGSCSLTAAWHRPDRFGKVLSFMGSFAQVAIEPSYPELVELSDAKPLRVLLVAATRDIGYDQAEGNWFASNLKMAAALAQRGYDMRLLLADGGHDPSLAGALLPDALRWLWRVRQTTPADGQH